MAVTIYANPEGSGKDRFSVRPPEAASSDTTSKLPPEPRQGVRPAAEGERASHRRSHHSTHIAAIDGLRAVAVLGVVAFHLGSLTGGYLGVDLFFVISGFVITSMLIHERAQTGEIDLRRFWVRRVKRLLPAVLAVLIGVQLWMHAVAPAGLENIVNGQTLAALVNVGNWYNIFSEFSYWDATGDSSPLNHLWSLAIEEQFYLLLPLLLLFLRSQRSVLIAACLGILASIALRFTVGAGWSFDRLYQGTDIRVVALLAGVALAALVVRPSDTRGRVTVASRSGRTLVGVAAAIATAATVVLWAFLPLGIDIFSGSLLAATALEVVLIAVIVLDPRGWLSRLLSIPPMLFIGRRSYALYLWHWPVIVIVSETHTGLTGIPLASLRVVLILGLTLVSFALIENPLRRTAARPVALGIGLGIPAALIAILCFIPTSMTAALWPKTDTPSAGSSAPDDPVWQASPILPGSTVMVVGDSWSVNLAEGMANPEFGTVVQNLGIGGCGILNPQAYQNEDGQSYAPPPQCLTWADDWSAAIAADRPDFAVIVAGNWDQKTAQVDGTWVGPGDATFDERYAQQLDRAIDIFTSQRIPVYVSTTVTLNDARERSRAMNSLILDAVERNPGATALDLGGYLCRPGELENCPTVRDGEPIFDATGHPSPYWQQKMAEYALGIITPNLKREQ